MNQRCAYCRRPGLPVTVPKQDFLSTKVPTHLCPDHKTMLYGLNGHAPLELLPPVEMSPDAGRGMWLVVSTDQEAPPRFMIVLANGGTNACEAMVVNYDTPCSAVPLGDCVTQYDIQVLSAWLRSGAHRSDTWQSPSKDMDERGRCGVSEFVGIRSEDGQLKLDDEWLGEGEELLAKYVVGRRGRVARKIRTLVVT